MLRTAIEAALKGGEILRQSSEKSRRIKHVDLKSANDFVTEADRQSQDAIIEFILKRFPHHSVLAEEEGGGIRGVEYRWIIDPLDGTNNFIHGFPAFAVSVAAEEYDEARGGFGAIECGAVINPLTGEVFFAQRGKGAWLNKEKIQVSHRGNMRECLLATGFPFRNKDYLEEFLRIFRNAFRAVSGIRRAGAAALDLCWTACGALDGFWEKGLSPWDIAAGSLIVIEAGGTVSDFGGENNYMESGDIIACTPEIHQDMLSFMRR